MHEGITNLRNGEHTIQKWNPSFAWKNRHLIRRVNIFCVSESKNIKDLDNICILEKMNM